MAKRRKSRKAPSAKQLAARKKFAAMAKSRAKKRRKTNPVKGASMTTRAKKRRAKNKTRHVKGYYPNPVRRGRRAKSRRRRNPIGGLPTMRHITSNLLIPAAFGAAGSIGLNIIWGYMPIPATWKQGALRHVVKGVGAIALGHVVGMVAGKQKGDMATVGMLTVILVQATSEVIARNFPQVQLGETDTVGMYSPGMLSGDDLMGEYMLNGVGEYQSSGIGENSQAGMEYSYG